MLKALSVAFVAGALLFVGFAGCNNFSTSPTGCGPATACANGAGSMEACYTEDSTGACATLSYKVGNKVFDCVSCDDQAYCKNAALVACGVPEASIPADADLPEGATLGGMDSGSSDSASAADTGSSTVDSGAAHDGGAADAPNG
jgi:hypothetical protein